MSSEKRKKNNEARMKVYAKNKEKEGWNQYEQYIVEHHIKKHKHTTWHWSRVPELHLYNAGYINDFNKHRLERLAESKEGINRHKDYGLDGFSLDSNETYHGLQAKYYSTNKVSANDIGSFQSVTRRLNKKNSLSKGYLYTSTNLEPTLAEDIQCIGDIIHEKVLFEPEDKRTTRHQKKIVNEIDLSPRPYQIEALSALEEEREGLGVLSLFCGGGKTFITGKYLGKLKPKIIIMVAPLKISVDNLCKRMECFFDGYEHLVIDSDTDNTTDPDVVKAKLDEDKSIILYTTFASAVNVLAEIFEDEGLIDETFILVDECHNIVNNTELCEFINRFYNGLLMSATIPEELYEVIDCEPVYEYGMAEAIKEGYCVDYNVWLPQIVKKDEGNTIEIDIPEEFEKSDLCAKVLFLVNGMLQTGSKRCIVYLRNKDECAAFTELFTKVSKTYHGCSSWTETIDCDVKQEKRRTILEDFQSDKDDLTMLHILASVRILDEAVDVVRCDSEFITYVGVNADDKRAVQRLQRGGRLDSSNLSKKNNLFIWCSEYSSMLSMLSLLKESDPEFHTKLRILNGNYDAVGKKESVEKSAVQLGDLQKYVEVRCLSNDKLWEIKYNEMVKFWEENRKFPLRKSINRDEIKLNNWVHMQRYFFSINKLPKRRIEKLNILDWWNWSKNFNIVWETNLEKLITYYNNNNIPSLGVKNIEEKSLALWMSVQRGNYRKNLISKERIEKLESLALWKWERDLEKEWYNKLEELIEFYKKYKKIPSGGAKNNHEKKLGIWASRQRISYKEKTLTNERIEKLKLLSWWLWDLDEKWNNTLKEVIEFYNKYKKIAEKSKDKYEKTLGAWISRQRGLYKNGEMPNERIKILEKIDWWKWELNLDELWNNNLQKVTEYYNKHNKLPSKHSKDKNEKMISLWAGTQRTYYRSGELSKSCIKKLEELNWWKWELIDIDEIWNDKLEKLIEFYNINKKLPLITNNKVLYYWKSDQRSNYRKDKLSKERIELLEKLEWWKW
uniref:Helicase ATP-binding domain-containing protein n=1 Tax=viral metagenome TaxID=1070528 RepID=A0A6C0D713_9ZZZZ